MFHTDPLLDAALAAEGERLCAEFEGLAKLPQALRRQARDVFALSPLCAQLCLHEPSLAEDLIADGAVESSRDWTSFSTEVDTGLTQADKETAYRFLRRLRKRESLRVAWRDLSGIAS